MRILIADDEALVRYGLASVLNDVLDDVLNEAPLILEAANGLELIRVASESRPHIAFVDIGMPKMNGLDAIAQAREAAPNVLWVILTGHADFAYAREALKLGVEDFLIKPADPAEIEPLMQKLILKARTRQIRGNRELEARISAVLGDTTSPAFDPYFKKPRFWQAALVLWDSLLPDAEEARRRLEFAAAAISYLENEDEFSGSVVSLRNGRLLVVFSVPAVGMPMDRVIDLWHRQFHLLRNHTCDILGDGIGDTWVLTRVVQDPQDLFREIDNLDMDAPLRLLHRPGTVMNFTEIAGKAAGSRFLPAAEILEDIGKTWRFGQEDDFHGLVHNLQSQIRNIADEDFINGGPQWFARFVVPLSGEAPENLEVLVNKLRQEGHSLFENRSGFDDEEASAVTLVDKAVAIMARRYRESIGIAQVAEELGVSPNYLSTIFKKETGTSFTRRMTDLRLEKACELLGRQDANIGEVARSLGYQSGRHFTRLFKERFNQTPSEWTSNQRI